MVRTSNSDSDPDSDSEGKNSQCTGMARSVRDLVSLDAWARVLEFAGEVENGVDSVGDVLELSRLVPGVRVSQRIKVGPTGAALLGEDSHVGAIALDAGSQKEAFFSALRVNRGLAKLTLSKCQLTATDMRALASALAVNTSLRELFVEGKRLIELGILASALERNATLRSLSLDGHAPGNELGSAFASVLVANSTLRELRFGTCGLSSKSCGQLAKGLRKNATLRRLGLYCNYIDDDGGAKLLAALEVHPALEEFCVKANELSVKSGNALVRVLGANSTLHDLDLSAQCCLDSVRSVQWTNVFPELKSNSSLVRLDVSMCGLAAHDVRALADALAAGGSGGGGGGSGGGDRCPGLRELNLSDNALDAEGALALADLVATNTSLRRLVARNNHLCDAGGVALGAALKLNASLEDLDVSGNDALAHALADALRTNRSLRALHVHGRNLEGSLSVTVVGDVGGLALAASIEAGACLEKLVISRTNMGERALGAMAKALRVNRKLRALTLIRNGGVTPNVKTSLREAAASNCNVLFT